MGLISFILIWMKNDVVVGKSDFWKIWSIGYDGFDYVYRMGSNFVGCVE